MNEEERKLRAEAAAFRGLVAHLQKRTDVQNIDLMNLSGFCRNCLSKWYMNAINSMGGEIDYEQARERVYGIPYSEWKKRHQLPATEEQLETFEKTRPLHADVSGH